MKRSPTFLWIIGLLTIFALASMSISQQPSPLAKDEADLKDPIEVQARGVLHEAFAQPFDLKPEPGPMVPKEPPPPIPEDPPEQRPEADNAQWIPGYWAYDAQLQDYMWVSGVYRVPPQGRTFVPGYWQHTPDGWRWVNGFWSDMNRQELPLTPEPPAPLDNGPSMPAPDDNSMYIPGAWVYRDSRFIWRPGYYSPVRVGRVWNPPYYQWTPNGYLFVDGYWDLPFEERGLIFAPVYFREPLWRDASWRYRPRFVVGFNAFFDSAFVGIGGFYFGDYYDPFYARHGHRPWYAGRGRYDPVFAYHGWQNHRNNPNWVSGAQTTFANRSAGRAAVPPRTLAQQTAFVNAKKGPPVVTPLNQFTSNQVKLVNTTPAQLETQRNAVQRNREIAVNRQQIEAVRVTQSDPGKEFRAPEAKTLKLPAVFEGKSVSPSTKIETPRIVTPKNDGPRTVTPPPPAPKITTSPPPSRIETPRIVTPPPPAPKVLTSPPSKIETPRIVTPPPQPAPKVVAPPPPAPRVVTPPPPPPRVVTPPTPAPRPAPPPAKKASINTDPPRIVTKQAAPVPKVAAPQNAPRVQSAPRVSAPAPRVQPAPRVSAPPPRSNPAPARNSPPPRPANNNKKR